MQIGFHINWLTFIGSIFNLLLLYIIFKRYLFGPIDKTIKEKREEWNKKEEELKKKEREIEEKLKEIEEQKQKVQIELQTLREKLQKEIEEEKKQILDEYQKKAETLYKQIVNAAQAEAARIIEEATQNISGIVTVSTKNILNNFIGTGNELCILKMLFKRFRGDIKQYASKVKRGIILELPWYVLPEEEIEIRQALEELGVSIAGIKVNENIISGFKLVYKDFVLDATLDRYISEAVGEKHEYS